jgi:hypothetical protein
VRNQLIYIYIYIYIYIERERERERERDMWDCEKNFFHTFRKKESCFRFIKMPFANHHQLWVLGLNQFYK